MKDVEHVVRNATNTWKNVYHLHKWSDFPIDVKDDGNNDDEDKDEEDAKESTHFVTVDYEEYKEQEAIQEKTQDDEEIDPVKIAAKIIASLPHSTRKPMMTSSIEIAQARLIVTTNENTNILSLFAPIQLSTSLNEVSSTSSTEL